MDAYGTAHLVPPPAEARRLWGYPRTRADISALFVRHLSGALDTLPWSEEPLSEETQAIRDELVRLNAKHWWTIASQPAVNGVPSNDRLFGWGPRDGFVFQKVLIYFLFLFFADFGFSYRFAFFIISIEAMAEVFLSFFFFGAAASSANPNLSLHSFCWDLFFSSCLLDLGGFFFTDI
jgi:hypothetical protein